MAHASDGTRSATGAHLPTPRKPAGAAGRWPQARAVPSAPPIPQPGRSEVPRPRAPQVNAVPMQYRGILFRSTLEADWAATFDFLNWHWEYEPGAVRVGDVNYLPDFRLPGQNAWVEVKGPHDVGLSKAHDLGRAITTDARAEIFVVGRPPGPGDASDWHCVSNSYDIRITLCGACRQWCFTRPERSGTGRLKHDWRCRHCGSASLIPEVSYIPARRIRAIADEFGEYDPDADWVQQWFGEYGRLKFWRAPRSTGKGARR